jgi:hypothetical protein
MRHYAEIPISERVVLRCPGCTERVVLLGREDDWHSEGRLEFECGGCGRGLTMAHRVGEDAGLLADFLGRDPAP